MKYKFCFKEWESLYQPVPLRQMIDQVNQEKQDLIKKRMEREKLIDENLAKHATNLANWQTRVQQRNRLALGATERRNRILAELKEEFGYDVNPNDEIMKTKIQEREKVLLKEERELKKKMRAEILEKRAQNS